MKKLKIGLPCSPASIVKDSLLNVQAIKVSYGGGMGGSVETHYCTNVDIKKDYYHCTLLNGDVIKVNPTFIVDVRDRKIVKVVTDVTKHRNYHKIVCKEHITYEHILLGYDQEYEITNGYEPRSNVVYKDDYVKEL